MPLRYQTGDEALEKTLRLHLHDLDGEQDVLVGRGGIDPGRDYLRLPAPPRLVGAALARLGREPALHRTVVARTGALRARVRAALGLPAGRGPRFLVRVDDFPRWDVPTSDYMAFHAALSGVPYLLAATPRLATAPLDPASTGERLLTAEERALLSSLAAEGVDVALHGLTHRTRARRPHSELAGLDEAATAALVDEGLDRLGVPALAFVPPFNHFGAPAYRALARRFRLVSAGGRESVHAFGFYTSPAWLEGAIYVPSYAPAYGRAEEVRRYAEELVRSEPEEVVIPITLHWAWERADGFAGVRALAREISARTLAWRAFAGDTEAALGRQAA